LKFSNPTPKKIGHEPKNLNIVQNNWALTEMFWASTKQIHPLDEWQLLIKQLNYFK
jgi:hypothetical protein